jgi:hypothetical protein
MSGLSAQGAMMGLEDLLRDMDPTANLSDSNDNTDAGETTTVVADSAVNVIEGGGEIAQSEVTETPAPVVATDKPKGKKGGKGKRAAKKDEPAAVVIVDKPTQDAPAAETQTEATTEDKPAAPAPEKRVFWGRNKLGRLEHRLGADVDNALLFVMDELDLEGEPRSKLIGERKAEFKKLAVKVQNRATNVLEYVTGKTQRLNPVIEITLRLLAKDRKIETGDKGNLFLRLSALYTGGSARAMGNSTMGMLKALQIVTETGKQSYAPNADSTLLAAISDKLMLSFIDRGEALALIAQQEADALVAAVTSGVVDTPETPADEAPGEPQQPVEQVQERSEELAAV